MIGPLRLGWARSITISELFKEEQLDRTRELYIRYKNQIAMFARKLEDLFNDKRKQVSK
jgi:hypothetical protein